MNRVADENTRDRQIVNPKVIFTISFVLGLLLLVILRTNGWRLPLPLWVASSTVSAPAGPEDAIYGMLDAARAGDTTFYPAASGGRGHNKLVKVIKETGEPNFAAYLKSQNSAFQGVAVS